jgi:hypothetical protein
MSITLPTPASIAARSCYLYVNEGAAIRAGYYPAPEDVSSRELYLYLNRGAFGWPIGGEPLDQDDVLARALYLYVNIGHDRDPSDVAARAVYTYETLATGEIFPWIEKIRPVEQYRQGQVNIYGDGFGATPAAEAASARLGTYDPTVSGPGLEVAVVTWTSRSPGLWPANLELGTQPAITVTVPVEGASGMVSVEETT